MLILSKAGLLEAEWIMVTREGQGGKSHGVGQWHKLQIIRGMSSGHLMYSIVVVAALTHFVVVIMLEMHLLNI